ncbi:MAG: M15 family metallopeptidase [Bacteroidales bacterium]|nr:M15 family metallopeptidase [Bacteroidales bacterium]
MKSKTWLLITFGFLILVTGIVCGFYFGGYQKKTQQDAPENIILIEEPHVDTHISDTIPEVDNTQKKSRETSAQTDGFVMLSEAVPDAILEIRYYSTYNFVGTRIDGYLEPVALLTKEAADALKRVSDDVMKQGYRLKIYDAYRPVSAVQHFMRWAADPNDTLMKPYFYPNLPKSVLFRKGYISSHSGHSRGSTVDLTLFDMNTEKDVDMGGTFDLLDPQSHPLRRDYVTEKQYQNRMILRNAMVRHGFKPIGTEWWHFTLINEPYPNTYFSFPVQSL